MSYTKRVKQGHDSSREMYSLTYSAMLSNWTAVAVLCDRVWVSRDLVWLCPKPPWLLMPVRRRVTNVDLGTADLFGPSSSPRYNSCPISLSLFTCSLTFVFLSLFIFIAVCFPCLVFLCYWLEWWSPCPWVVNMTCSHEREPQETWGTIYGNIFSF